MVREINDKFAFQKTRVGRRISRQQIVESSESSDDQVSSLHYLPNVMSTRNNVIC